jgi:biopolymer transport protein ExbD/DNA-directed RNA polymerase subunit RPC12/RpoP
MIRFNCHECGKKFKAPDELAGRVVSCSACRTKITVPSPFVEATVIDEKSKDEEHEAFTFEMPKRPVFEDLVDMTAMVDIVFFLLIFFMVTSMQGLYSAIGIPPPNPEKTSSKVKRNASDYENDAEYVVVRIDRDNTMWTADEKIPSEQDLHIKLRNARQGVKGAPPMKKLMVLGNGDAHTVSVVKVIDAGNDAGMEEVQLALDDGD